MYLSLTNNYMSHNKHKISDLKLSDAENGTDENGEDERIDISDEHRHLSSVNTLERINVNNILWNAVLNNKIIILSIIPLFAGYYLQDTIFTRAIAKVTSDIPGFVEDINFNKVLIVILPYLIALILFYISNIISTKTISKIELDTVSELTDKLIESIKTSKKQINVNDLIIHIKKVNDTKHIYEIIILYIIPTFIVAFGLIYNFIQTDGKASLLVILIIIIMVMVTTKLEFDSVENAYKTEEASNDLYDEIHEIMANIDSVITSDTKDFEMKNVRTVSDKNYKLSCISENNNSNTTYGLQVSSMIAMLGINYISYNLYTQKKIDGALFTSTVLLSILFMDYYNYCVHAISTLVADLGRYSETQKYFQKFIINGPESGYGSESDPGPKLDLPMYQISLVPGVQKLIDLKVNNGQIVFRNLTLGYGNKMIFNNFNLKIMGHTVNGLIGPIGSGKTSMLKMLAGIIDYQGEILIDNQNLKNCSYESIVANIAYIPQHPKLFNKSVYYNINYGSSYTKNQIIAKLNKLGLGSFINSLTNKLDTISGKEGSKLSGGQRQFIFLIRSIIQNKKIFLLDEPSSSLDSKNKEIFISLINNIKNKTIIISTHDDQILPLFNRVINIGKPLIKQK